MFPGSTLGDTMNMKRFIICVVSGFFSLALSLAAQTASSSPTASQVPPLIQFSNVATDEGGNTLSGVVSITFSLYNGQQGGEPLWTETQNNVQLDGTGRYSVQLGITQPNGVPTTLFTSGEARWLGVQVAQQPEQSRVLLISVPYALKAGDAATIGGLPPSAFVLAAPPNASPAAAMDASATPQSASSSSAPPPTNPDVTGTGTVDFLPLWDATSDIINSVLFQSGTGSTAKIGINTTTPASALDVKGGATIRGTLSLPAISTATATKGSNSQPLDFAASVFNSSTSKAVAQTFQWQAEPATGTNNTGSPSGTLNLLFGSGTTAPGETGLNIASSGLITFATGQTFPGTGDGTITGITTATGSGLTGGATSGTVSLGLTTACANNQVLQWNGGIWACFSAGTGTITSVIAGTDLTGGGTSGSVTLNLNTANIAQLNANNIFNGSQTVSGNLTATGVVSGSSFQIGSNLFAFGTAGNVNNAFLGFAGSSTSGGFDNTAVGSSALANNNGTTGGPLNTAAGYNALTANTTGYSNTAVGAQALESNQSGAGNTAVGSGALDLSTGNYNTSIGYATVQSGNSGNYNTALGAEAGPSSLTGVSALSGMTAIGANSKVSQSNSLVLGVTTQGSPGNAWVSVGIGTDTPRSIFEAAENQLNAVGPVVTLTNGASSTETSSNTSAAALDFNTYLPSATGTYNPGARIEAQDTGSFSDNLFFQSKTGGANGGLQTNMTILSTGLVGIGTITPAATLEVNGTAKFDNLVTFAPGQTFGSGGSGTVTSVGLTAPSTDFVVTGSPVTASGTLGLGWIVAPDFNDTANAIVKRDSSGNFTAGAITGSSFQISNGTSSNPFAYGSYANFNAFLGFAGNSSMTGLGNTASGYQALYSNAAGSFNTATGQQALYSNCPSGGCTSGQGGDNTASGALALYSNTTGNANTATGLDSLFSNTTGSYNTANGEEALYNNCSSGSGGCSGAQGIGNTAAGFQALANNSTGSYNAAFGYEAGPVGIVNNSTAIGAYAEATASNAMVLGSIANVNGCETTATPACQSAMVGIGTTAPGATLDVEAPNGNPPPTVNFGSASNPATLTVNGTGSFTGAVTFAAGQTFPGVAQLGAANTFTGTQTITGDLDLPNTNSSGTQGVIKLGGLPFIQDYGVSGSYNSFFGFKAGNLTNTGSFLTAVGDDALASDTTGSYNTASGYSALTLNTSGSYNTASGAGALNHNTSGGSNTAIGYEALLANVTASGNVAVGYLAALQNTGSNNAAIGAEALAANTTGGANTAVGWEALAANVTTSGNVAVGYLAAQKNTANFNTAVGDSALLNNITGTNNTALGISAGPTIDGFSNTTAIGSNAVVSESNAVVLGCIASQYSCPSTPIKVGIGTAAPLYTLDVEAPSGSTAPTVDFGSASNPASFTVNGNANVQGNGNFNTATGTALDANTSAASGYAIYASNNATTGTNSAVFAQSTSPNSTGVSGTGGYFGVSGVTNSTLQAAAGVVGTANGNGQTEGVYGLNFSNTNGAVGVLGNAAGTSGGTTYGVYGETASPNGTGVYGVAVGPSVTGNGYNDGIAWGVWGDTSLGGVQAGDLGYAVLGTADNSIAGRFANNSSTLYTLYAENFGGGPNTNVVNQRAPVLSAYGGSTGKGCTMDTSGTLNCEGTVTAVVPTNSGAHKVSLYAVQSPENWFEDFGSGTLTNGAATITLDPTFTQTVNTGTEYHVFLTPNGDSNGLYVSQKTATSFEVREQGGGHSSIAFDYRIVAKRSGYENVRLTDVTEQYKKMAEQRELQRGKPGQRPVRPSILPPAIPKMPTPPALPVRAAAQPMPAQPK